MRPGLFRSCQRVVLSRQRSRVRAPVVPASVGTLTTPAQKIFGHVAVHRNGFGRGFRFAVEVIEFDWKERRRGVDAQLNRALESLKTGRFAQAN